MHAILSETTKISVCQMLSVWQWRLSEAGLEEQDALLV